MGDLRVLHTYILNNIPVLIKYKSGRTLKSPIRNGTQTSLIPRNACII